jgi:uncharacterized repeat protein (TIGR01451 family)
MKRFAVVIGALAVAVSAVPAVAQENSIIIDLPEAVVEGDEGDVIQIWTEPVPAHLIGASCDGALQIDNNASTHPNNDLILMSGDDVVEIENVEAQAGVTIVLDETLGPLGETIVLSIRLGRQGISSTGFMLTLDCQPPVEPNPAIDIEKATNGEDADTPTGPQILVGDAVTWTYVVTNTGDVDLSNVTVTDDQGVAVTCPQDALTVGEAMTCTASGTAELGQYANIGTVTGVAPDESVVTDTDPSHYIGVETPVEPNPAIDIEKSTNGEDADTEAEAVNLFVGDAITWEYVVTNTGSVDLTSVVVTDDQGVAVSCPQDTLVVAETMTCTGTGVAVNTGTGTYANIGTVTGTAPDDSTVTDSDPSHYEATQVGPQGETPAIQIVKDPDSQSYTAVPATATWTITVTNIGTADLMNVTVTDARAPGCDRVIGDLAVGASTSYECSLSGITASLTNVAVVTGNDANGIIVTDDDDAIVEIELPPTGGQSQDLAIYGVLLLAAGAALIAPKRIRRNGALDA